MPRSPHPSRALFAVTLPSVLLACVPPGNSTPSDAGAPTQTAARPIPTARPRLSSPPLLSVFEDTFDRPDAGTTPPAPTFSLLPVPDASVRGKDGGLLATEDGGEAGVRAPHLPPGSDLGPDWVATRPGAWRIEKGKLCGEHAANHGVWLNRTIPTNARIEFDAMNSSDEGDLKTEVWGDGVSFAKGNSYSDATSYLAILGGWKNTLHVLARLDEHGDDRKVLPVDLKADDIRQRPVTRGQIYRFKVERTDGRTVDFYVDGRKIHSWTDSEPLLGPGHDHMGFNNWEMKVCYDNVKVTPLP